MKSMTGFGRGEALTADGKISFRVEISSVNRKQFELKLSLPKEMLSQDMEIRRLVSSRISRGSLSMRVEAVSCGLEQDALTINRAKALSLLRELQSLSAECGISGELQSAQLLQVPGIIEQKNVDYTDPALVEPLKAACETALDNLIRMRETEGENLRVVLTEKIKFLAETVDRIEPLAVKIPLMQKEKLLKRLQDNDLPLDPSDDRILRELVIYSDRSDVSEELTRLRSHFSHFLSFLNNADEALGRNMDFLSQEIFRELNTLGNKAPTTEISPLIVQLKTEVEKIREQIQNIE